MQLQGLDKETKVELLTQLTTKEISLAEFQEKAQSIKTKKRVAEEFMRYTGSASWQELRRRFPKHATEEKLAPFSRIKLKAKGKELPMVKQKNKKPIVLVGL